jgi:hypothetical protein
MLRSHLESILNVAHQDEKVASPMLSSTAALLPSFLSILLKSQISIVGNQIDV